MEGKEKEVVINSTKRNIKSPWSIEKSMAGGIDTLIDSFVNDSKKITKHERDWVSMLIDEPFLGDFVKNKLALMKHERGWFTKRLEKMWKPFVGGFHSLYQSKRIQKALTKSQGNNRDLW